MTNKAFEDLFNKEYKKLLVHIKYKFNQFDESESEDIVSESFLRLYNVIHSFDYTIGSPKTFLYRIAFNLSIDKIRKDNRYKTKTFSEITNQPMYNEYDSDDNIDRLSFLNKLVSGEEINPFRVKTIRETLKKILNEKEYRFIYLRYVFKYRLKEISELENINVNSIKSIFFRAHIKMNECVELKKIINA